MTTKRGLVASTKSKNCHAKRFRGSFDLRRPASENPWHGGPPATRSRSEAARLPIDLESFSSVSSGPTTRPAEACSVTVASRWLRQASSLLVSRFLKYDSPAIGDFSTARRCVPPARLSPSERPPHPAKRSTYVKLRSRLSLTIVESTGGSTSDGAGRSGLVSVDVNRVPCVRKS